MSPPTSDGIIYSSRHKVVDRTRTRHDKTVQTAQEAPVEPFPIGRLPTELQLMIWDYVLKAPACHTFKLQKRWLRPPPAIDVLWDVVLKPHQKNADNSAWRRWEELHSLGDTIFKMAFRQFTSTILPIELQVARNQIRPAAAINAATDLVIFEFQRGLGDHQFNWFEHSNLNNDLPPKIELQAIRARFSHIRKVAICYKAIHPNCFQPSPLWCTCPNSLLLSCKDFNYCPHETACFLDSFPNLEEFYVIVEQRRKAEREFASPYRSSSIPPPLPFSLINVMIKWR